MCVWQKANNVGCIYLIASTSPCTQWKLRVAHKWKLSKRKRTARKKKKLNDSKLRGGKLKFSFIAEIKHFRYQYKLHKCMVPEIQLKIFYFYNWLLRWTTSFSKHSCCVHTLFRIYFCSERARNSSFSPSFTFAQLSLKLNRKSIWRKMKSPDVKTFYLTANEMQMPFENCFFIRFPIPYIWKRSTKKNWKVMVCVCGASFNRCVAWSKRLSYAIKPSMDMHIMSLWFLYKF